MVLGKRIDPSAHPMGCGKEAGLKSASFLWPVSVDAPIDYNLPEYWSLEESFGRIEPMREKEAPAAYVSEFADRFEFGRGET